MGWYQGHQIRYVITYGWSVAREAMHFEFFYQRTWCKGGRIDASGLNAMFGDDSNNFALAEAVWYWYRCIEKLVIILSSIHDSRIGRDVLQRKMYSNISFYNPDRKIMFTVFDENWKYHQGKDRAWIWTDIASYDDNQEKETHLINIAI